MISIIAAIGKNNELGKNNDLIWHLPSDLRFFKSVTTGCPVVMGLNTYKSIGKPLPNRENIILSDKPLDEEGITVYNDINILTNDITNNNGEYFIIGGASLYNYYYPLADKMLVMTAFIMLVGQGKAPGWVVAIIVCRELAVTGLRLLLVEEKRRMEEKEKSRQQEELRNMLQEQRKASKEEMVRRKSFNVFFPF